MYINYYIFIILATVSRKILEGVNSILNMAAGE